MIALKNLLRKKLRTLLSISGIAIAIAAMVAFISIANGVKQSFSLYARESGAHLIVFQKDVAFMDYSRVPEDVIEKIKKIPGVADVGRSIFAALKIPGLPFGYILGRDPHGKFIQKYKRNLQGELLKNDDEIMLGIQAAESLKKKVGDNYKIGGKEYKVVGIFRSPVFWEEASIIMSFKEVQERFSKLKRMSALLAFVYLEDPAKWMKIKQEIENQCPGIIALPPDQVLQYFKDQVAYFDWFVWAISLVAVIVGALGILNTMMMNISERVREIGTLRAVGWSKFMIVILITTEGILLALIGGILGSICGVIASEILVFYAPKGLIAASYTIDIFIKAGIVCLGVGIFGSVYPSWTASRIIPAEALRYE